MAMSPGLAGSMALAAPQSQRANEAAAGRGVAAQEGAALAEAARTGRRVEVKGLRTETSQVFANPGGTFTRDAYALPQWVRQGGTLVRIDTTLRRNGDGTLSPKAAEVGVRFSGGGTGPLVTIVRDGRSMAWSWPRPLPAPVVDGDTVTYRDILKDVDLKLKADSGGFGQLLVVKTAEAAADPALKEVGFGLRADGVTVATDAHGNMTARNPAGQQVFGSPTPLMWDSSTGSAPAGPDGRKTVPPRADEFEAPYGARRNPVGIRARSGKLSLVPDSALLRGKDTRFPVYIDPYVSGAREAWTIAYKKYPDSSFWNGTGWGGSGQSTKEARVGYENVTNGLSRTFFRLDSNNLWDTDKVIKNSTFRIKNTWSWSCTDRPVEVWSTGAISSATTWNKQPTWSDKALATVNDSKGWSSTCPAGNLAFDVTSAARKAATDHSNNITLGMRAPKALEDAHDEYTWKKFDATTAVLSTEYNTVPSVPASLDTVPSTKNPAGCGDTAPYGSIGDTDVYLTAKVADPDGGTVSARFNLWATGHHDDGPGVFLDQTVSVTSGTVAMLKVPKATLASNAGVSDGDFSWTVQTGDGALTSAWAPTTGSGSCRFAFDPARPSSPPGVTSQEFPNGSGGWPANTGTVHTEGTFTVSNGGVTDVTEYEYWTSWDPTHRTASPSSPGGSVDLKLTPPSAGASQLYVRSRDKAGNSSDITSYLFYVNGRRTPGRPGDLNGDGNADIWGVDAAGRLHRFFGTGDGTVTEASGTAGADDWTGTRITHRGDWTGDGEEDLIALRHDTALNTDRLWIHPNDGTGYACTACPGGARKQELGVYEPANDHWKDGAKQILAIGDVDGPLDVDGDGTVDVPGFPDLLVNTGTALWLYYGSPDNHLDSTRDPVLLAAGDSMSDGGNSLDKITLAAPGDYSGDGQVDLLARFDAAGGLYVYDAVNPDGPAGAGQVGPAHRSGVGRNWGTDAVPLLTAAPDANNNGKFDLWATVPGSGNLRIFADFDRTTNSYTAARTASAAFAGYTSLG
ncbi:FG-GAP-like repeat-containing protein [Actinomadura fibrosa]|uniref:FG-GAP-like repeat-containing protein n=1 Tax=Actinomadura fibrosa TaxID=111802 RepID=A0ABW2XPE4_9ACTN|nr:FG-GAP-like repeat-containing protein [Actinomadura fibrosa]